MRGRFVKIFSIIFSTVFFSLFFVRFTQAKCIPDQCNSQEDCNKLIPNKTVPPSYVNKEIYSLLIYSGLMSLH